MPDEVDIEQAPQNAFEILSHPCRRCLLHYFLSNRTKAAELDDIYEFIELRTDLEMREAQFRAQARHQHIPLLEEKGFIEYDERNEMVRYHRDPLAEACLKLVAEHDID